MAVTQDPRFGTDRWSAGTDSAPGRAGWDTLLDLITTKAVVGLQGTAAARPAPAIASRVYFATDTSRLYWDTGTQWIEVSPVGGGGYSKGLAQNANGVPVEGTSRIAARSDHVHNVDYMMLSQQSAIAQNNLASSTWWRVTMANGYDHSGGFYQGTVTPMTGDPHGVTVAYDGLYTCSGSFRMETGPSATGRRAIGFANYAQVAGPGPTAQSYIPAPSGPANGSFILAFSRDLWFAAGTVVTLFAYQESGAPLNVLAADLCVRRAG